MSPPTPNIFLNVIFAALSGHLFALSSIVPAYFSFKDEQVSEDEIGGGDEEGRDEVDQTRLESFCEDKGDHDNSKKRKTSKCMWKFVYFLSIALQAIGLCFSFLSMRFGPVSIYSPVSSTSGILSTVILLSYILGIEKKPEKDKRLGNCKFN